ncbi:hypothetical protein PHET_03400, partial [Paragonimus heterotremus]
TWLQSLQDSAQLLADTCKGNHDSQIERAVDEFSTVGQNIVLADSVETGLEMWIMENEDFDHLRMICAYGANCDNYTQIMWATTTRVGCGKSSCSNDTFFVCNYGPEGNQPGQTPYERDASNCTVTGLSNSGPTNDLWIILLIYLLRAFDVQQIFI